MVHVRKFNMYYYPIVYKHASGATEVIGSGVGRTERQALQEFKKQLKVVSWEKVEGHYPYPDLRRKRKK